MTPVKACVRQSRSEDGGLLRVHVDAGKGNVWTGEVMAALAGALAEHAGAADVRMVLITAEGPHFSYGASVAEHRREQVAEMLSTFHNLLRALALHPVPVAAFVRGRCLGGAFEGVLACHLVFVAPDARFAVPEIKLGVFPPAFATLGPLRLPGAWAERLMLTGDELTADDAVRVGLAVPADAEDAVVAWYRERLAPLSAASLRHAVAASREASGVAAAVGEALARAEARYLGDLLPSHDAGEGVAAFLDRRPPRWEHR